MKVWRAVPVRLRRSAIPIQLRHGVRGGDPGPAAGPTEDQVPTQGTNWTPPKTSGRIRVGLSQLVMARWERDMVDRSPGFFDLDDRLAELSAKGDSLERMQTLTLKTILRKVPGVRKRK